MDRSRERWAEALGVATREVVFGPSTSMNTYVLAQAFAADLRPDDVVIVTNQDHEANTGAIRRAAERVGCTIREWRTDADHRPARHRRVRRAGRRSHGARDGSARLEHHRAGERHRPHHHDGARGRCAGDRRRRLVRAAHPARRRRARCRRVSVQPLQDVLGAPGPDGRAQRAPRRAAEPEPLLQRRCRRQAAESGRTRPRAGRGRRGGARLRRSRCTVTTGVRPTIGLRVAASDCVGALAGARGCADAAAARRARRSGRRAAARSGDGRCERSPPVPDRRVRRRCATSRAMSPTNSCSVASRPAPATTTRPVCSTASVSIPTGGWCGSRSSTTRRRADLDRAIAALDEVLT